MGRVLLDRRRKQILELFAARPDNFATERVTELSLHLPGARSSEATPERRSRLFITNAVARQELRVTNATKTDTGLEPETNINADARQNLRMPTQPLAATCRTYR